MRNIYRLGTASLLLAGFLPFASGSLEAQQEPYSTPEALVRHLYDLATFPAGTVPDWDSMRTAFIPQAVIVLRTSRTESTVMSVDAFVQDWLDFIERANVEETGFSERIVKLVPVVVGDIAHVWVLYEAHIPGRDRPPQQGVDSFQLIRQAVGWRIASVVNEIPTPARPVPDVLRQ